MAPSGYLGELDELVWLAGEDRSHEEWLGDELFRQLVIEMNITNDGGVEHTGRGIKRIQGGIDSKLGQGTGQHSGGVQVSEGDSGGGIIVSTSQVFIILHLFFDIIILVFIFF